MMSELKSSFENSEEVYIDREAKILIVDDEPFNLIPLKGSLFKLK